MKIITIVSYAAVTALAVLGLAMAKTNPSQDEYEEYATTQLADYLKKDVCAKAPSMFENLLRRNCGVLVDTSRPQMQQIISQKTQRRDFLIFSVYHTELKVNSFLPAYEFETVGAFDTFYTYMAEEM